MSVLFMAAIESAGVPADPDLTRYAITQGGLLAVVMVLLYFYRKDFRAQIADQDERLEVMTGLVIANTTAMTKAASASEANEKAAHRLSRALEIMEPRRRMPSSDG